MSQALALFSNAQVPAHVVAMAQRSALAEIKLPQAGGVPRISIKNGRFTIVRGKDDEQVLESLALNCVLVGIGATDYRAWYAKGYDPKAQATSPDCWSADSVKPDASCVNPQNALCAGCEKDAWGSKNGTTQAKACGTQRRVVLVAEGDEGGDIYTLNLAPQSAKNLGTYIRGVQKRGYAIESLVTQIKFDPTAQGVLVFDATRWLDEAEAATVAPRVMDGDVTDALEVSFSAADGFETPLPAKQEPAPEAAKKGNGFGAKKQEAAAQQAPAATKGKGFGAAKQEAAQPAAAKAKGFGAAQPAAAAQEATVVAGGDLADMEAAIDGILGSMPSV